MHFWRSAVVGSWKINISAALTSPHVVHRVLLPSNNDATKHTGLRGSISSDQSWQHSALDDDDDLEPAELGWEVEAMV